MNNERFEDVVARELAAYQEQLEQRRPSADAAADPADGEPHATDSLLELPVALRQELDDAKRCLDLLHGLRKPQSPPVKPGYGHERDPETRPTERFQRLDELGSGGFGVVWRARDPVTGRIVALKVPRPEVLASPELRKRFEQEAEAAARLDHPNIVPILEAGADGIVPYIASVYYEGPTLARWLTEHEGRVAPRTAAMIALTLARALTHAHERGVLHRDVKPSNVLLAPVVGSEAFGLPFDPKLMDFGLAKLGERDQELTRTGAMLGTLKYMAPEQAAGRAKEITAATDVYGLGVVLYEMLAGAPPFSADSDWLTLRQVLEDEPRSVSSIRRDVPRDLAVIVQKCLNKTPAQRYHSARDLADDLQRYLAGKSIVARPVPPAERLVKWCRRNPAWAALVGVVALGLVSGVAFLSYSNMRITALLKSEQATHQQLAMRLYAADMRRADEAFDRSNINLTREILSQYERPKGIDMREFAWRFLWDRLPQQRLFVGKHPQSLYSIQLSPDGKFLATGGADRYVRVWRPGASQPEHKLSCGRTEVNEVAFSPNGKLLAAACVSGSLFVWNTDDWKRRHDLEIGGVVEFDFHNQEDKANAVVVQENGMILTAGTGVGKRNEGLVHRFKPHGQPDPSFGKDGTMIFLSGPEDDVAKSLLSEPDGKVVVVGCTGGDDFVVGRLNPSGSADLAFGDQGYATIDMGSSEDIPLALARQQNGRYLVCGGSSQGGRYDVALVRLLNDGALDPSFGEGGRRYTNVGPGRVTAAAMAVAADDKIVIAGNRREHQAGPESEDIVVLRYDADGHPDEGFGQHGCVELGFCEQEDLGHCVAVQADGKVVIGGRANLDGAVRMVAVRLEPNGALDPSFGGAGVVRIEFDRPNSAAHSVLIQPDGKIVLAGVTGLDAREEFALARLHPDGSLDETFGANGRVTLQVGAGSGLTAAALLPNGEIVACGYARCGGAGAEASNLAIARFLPNGKPDRGLSADGAQGLLFTSDSKRLISYTHQCIRIWDMATGEIAEEVYVPENSLDWVELSRDETKLIAAAKQRLWIWDFRNLQRPPASQPLHVDTSTAVALESSDELLVAFASGQQAILNIATGEELRSLEHGRHGRARRLRLSGNQQLLAVMFTNSVSVFRTQDWTEIADIAAEGRLYDVNFTPDSNALLLCNTHGMVTEWELPAEGTTALGNGGRTLYKTEAKVVRVALSPSGDRLAIGSSDGGTSLVDARTGKIIHRVIRPNDDVRGLGFPSEEQFLVGHASGHVVAVQQRDGAARNALVLKHPIKQLQTSADGRYLAIALDEARTVEVFAWPSATLICSIPQKDEVSLLTFSASGRELIVTGAAHIDVFAVATGKRLGGEFQPGNTYNAVQLLSNGSQFLVAEGLNGIALRELPSCRLVRRMLGDARGIVHIAMSPDGRNVVSGGPTREVLVWDTQTWEQVLAIEYSYAENSLGYLLFSRSGNRVFGIVGENVVAWDAPVADSRP